MIRSRVFLLLVLCLSLMPLAFAQTSIQTPSASAGTQGKSSAVLPATITGSGTTDYVALWTSSTALGNSAIYQKGTDVGIDNTTPAWALDVTGYINASSGYKIGDQNVLTTPGGTTDLNLAVGLDALLDNTTGKDNTATGIGALEHNTSGSENTASGTGALQTNTTASANTATGDNALQANSTGASNTGIGYVALEHNTTGSDNTAVGNGALYLNTTGGNNIGIGYFAGEDVSDGNSNNIEIGNVGSSTDSGAIRIGSPAIQTSFFAAGIYGVSSGSNSAIPVLVDSSGQLVTVSSSRRFKEDIQDMGDASSGLMRLRPVTFRYRKPLDDGSQPVQYGLIAEEVAEVYPGLVAHSADGQIETVKYQLLDPMLLNEVQRQQAAIRDLQERLSRMEAALAAASGTPGAR
ncbi:MAG: tail fiber domain-containing protein [Terriglobales bacterium]|jgi:hypothetical protein